MAIFIGKKYYIKWPGYALIICILYITILTLTLIY
jgi:hypothetical protein